MIANRQATLDLGTLLDRTSGSRDAETVQTVEPVGGRSLAKTKLYLHLSLTDLLGLDGSDGSDGDGTGFGTVERFGPATIARIKDWAGRSRVTIQPVLDMARDRRRRRPRPTRLDAGTRHPARQALRVPVGAP